MSTVIGLVLVMLYFTLYLPCNFLQNHIPELKLVKKIIKPHNLYAVFNIHKMQGGTL